MGECEYDCGWVGECLRKFTGCKSSLSQYRLSGPVACAIKAAVEAPLPARTHPKGGGDKLDRPRVGGADHHLRWNGSAVGGKVLAVERGELAVGDEQTRGLARINLEWQCSQKHSEIQGQKTTMHGRVS